MRNVELGSGKTSFGITIDVNAHVHFIATDYECDISVNIDLDPTTAGTLSLLLDSSADAAWKTMVRKAS